MSKKFDRENKAAAVIGKSVGNVIIEQPQRLGVTLEVTGDAPLIQNNFSQKSLEQMLRKHMGLSTQKEPKKPRECVEHATTRNKSGRVCIAPTAFKKAMLTAAAEIKGLFKTKLRVAMFVEGQSIPITFESMNPRMDMVRTSGIGRTPDVRFRPEFNGWKARMRITFSDTLAVQTVVDLLNRAGRVGVGEWRPEKDGTMGTFYVSRHIDDAEEIAEVHDECRVGLVPLTIPDWAMDAAITPEMMQRIARGDAEEETSSGGDDEAAA